MRLDTGRAGGNLEIHRTLAGNATLLMLNNSGAVQAGSASQFAVASIVTPTARPPPRDAAVDQAHLAKQT
jgi:hypothetical protein